MIKGISKIKGLGVYDNYKRPSSIQEFGIKNLIYGWNYSGKTTLSRLFAQLETKKLNHDLIGCEFSFETDGQPITEKNLDQSDLIVRVFNSDFIRENLHFEGSNFKPILLLGKDSEDAQRKIDDIADRIKKSENTRRTLEIEAKAITQTISTSKTEAAKNLRQLLKIDPYTATQLGNDIPIVSLLGFKILSEKDLSENIELSLTPDNKKPSVVDKIVSTPFIESIHKEAVTTLASTPNFANTIKHLEDHPEIERWVESGLKIHQHAGACEFCGNAITEHRLTEFRAHFSTDLAEHKQKFENLLQRVKQAELKLSLPKEVEFNPQFRDDYKIVIEALPKAIDDFNQAVKILADDVKRKIDAPHKLLEPTSLAEGLASAVTHAVDAINALIEKNNQLADNFIAARKTATTQVRYHYVQEFIDAQKKAGYERKKGRLIQHGDRLSTFADSLRAKTEELQALISKAQLGREKINERLASMLGGEAIQIIVTKDLTTNLEQFNLVRKSGKIARNLSDGERTAIAFSYFITKLQELKPEDFKKAIVYIDDPISSLDANHIFQITAAIRAIFFTREHENSAWETTCKQLFVSTHNFEFFNLLREIKPESPKQGGRLFLIKRISETHSTINDMPKSLANYQSEYHFLFEVIYHFHQAPDKTDHTTLMLLPNAMRRFIELYTYSRLPGTMKETVDQRAEALFGLEKSKRILKVFHYFSHANTIDRLVGNNELIFDIEHAVKDLIEAITQTDQKHMDALIASL
jgi:wobble nucleotide-excising tRNase